jgi:folylpolyglutamate synthase/dihydropteroate synthase
VPDEIVREGFAAVEMPGRFEVIGHQPLVILDGAHNPPGADASSQVFFDDFDPAGMRYLVVGCLRGRDPARCSRRCAPTSSTSS